MTKKRIIGGLFIFFLVGGIIFLARDTMAKNNAKGNSPDPNKITVVKVNGDRLTKAQFDQLMKKRIDLLKQRHFPVERINKVKPQLQQIVINDYIYRTLIRQEAKREKIKVTDKDINAAIEEMKKAVPPGVTFDMVLRANGFTPKTIRDETRLRLMAQGLLKRNINKIPEPDKKSIDRYYEQNKEKFKVPEMVHARHILIKVDKNADEKKKAALKKKAEKIRAKLLKGADFAKLAKEYSDCPSKERGGDLGSFRRGVMVKPFDKAAFSQKVNEIGPIVETRFGYHIIQVLSHEKAHTQTLDEVKGKIKEKLMADTKLQLWKDYLNRLKKNAKIVYAKAYQPPMNQVKAQ